jgi:hypothetical protein
MTEEEYRDGLLARAHTLVQPRRHFAKELADLEQHNPDMTEDDYQAMLAGYRAAIATLEDANPSGPTRRAPGEISGG